MINIDKLIIYTSCNTKKGYDVLVNINHIPYTNNTYT